VLGGCMARSTSGRRRGGRATGARALHEKVKTARGRKLGSTRWLARQLNDPVVAEARQRGLRSRAAIKLEQIDDRFTLLATGQRVLDLGAAPGGWTQIAVARVGPAGTVVGVDTTEVETIAGAAVIVGDVCSPDLTPVLRDALAGDADIVLSDMAPDAIGHALTDHLRSVALAEAALDLATDVLAPGGSFVVKLLQGADEPALFARLRTLFDSVHRSKPPASRAESAEMYLVATGFTAPADGDTD
jgi:23S rRNA (uridine2552-2'-O)-methyltransferase